MPDGEADTDRTAVKTYVPRYQKAEWAEHADDLDMTQSEFVRTMVQAGRRGFLERPDPGPESDPDEAPSSDVDPGGQGLEDRVLDALISEGHYSWDELVEKLQADFEDRLDEALDDLQAQNRVRYSGRHGGYTAVTE